MGTVTRILSVCLLLISFRLLCSEARRNIAGDGFVFKYNTSNGSCMIYASFHMKFTYFYFNHSDSMSTSTSIPTREDTNITGQCYDNHYQLTISWGTDYSSTLTFTRREHDWYMSQVGLNFTNKDVDPGDNAVQSYVTEETKLFNRTFKNHQYFYCKRCKMFYFTNNSACDISEPISRNCSHPCVKNKNQTSCSHVEMTESVIFIGSDIGGAKKRLCIEDYIALQEIIVPIVVGGVLGILLVLILVAYIVAYVRRRRKEANSQYEPVGDY